MTTSHVLVICVVLLLTLAQGLSDASILDWLAGNDHGDTRVHEGEKIVPPGQNISLSCTGNGSLMWLSENNQKTFVHGDTLRHTIATYKYPPKRLMLDIFNADFMDVGRYVCIENDTEANDVYVYVFDTMQCEKQHLMVPVNDDQRGLRVAPGEKLIIPCHATHPDIKVTLQTLSSSEDISTYDPRVGFTIQHAQLHHVGPWECQAIFGEHCYQSVVFSVDVAGDDDDWVSVPVISGSKKMHKAVGENVCLECSVNASHATNIDFYWRLPSGQRASKSEHIDIQRTEKRTERSSLPIITTRLVLYVNGLSQDTDFGSYKCEALRRGVPGEKPKMDIVIIHKGLGDFVSIRMESEMRNTTVKVNEQVQWALNYNAKPPDVGLKWMSPNGKVLYGNYTRSRFSINHNKKQMSILLKISNVTVEDAGVYTLQATAGTVSETTNLTLVVQYPPMVKINGTKGGYFEVNSRPIFNCIVKSYSTNNVTWRLKECNNVHSCLTNPIPQKNTHALVGSTVQFYANQSGLLTCMACNTQGCKSDSRLIIISDIPEGVRIDAPVDVAVGDSVRITCIVPRFNCSGHFFWRQQVPKEKHSTLVSTDQDMVIEQIETPHSLYSTLIIKSVRKEHALEYICIATNCNNNGEVLNTHQLEPRELKAPKFENVKPNNKLEAKEGASNIRLDCEADGSPVPQIKWSKDGEPLELIFPENGTSRVYFASKKNMTLVLDHVIGSDDGEFQCDVHNRVAGLKRKFTLSVKQGKKSVSAALVVPIIIICILLLCVVVYLARRVKREKRKVRTLTAQDVRVFLEGAEESIDPDMDLDQQADLLPYNTAYEYPREHLKLGRQLGAGAFGRVVRAEATVPLFGSDHTAEDGGEKLAGPTIVAVKMVKPHAELTHLKALMTELKILIHVGKHLNVVNLLGACTTNLAKKELLVIVEYCCFGNLHSFLLRQRDNFVDQVDHLRDVFDFSIGSSIEPGRYQNLSTEHRQVAFNDDLKAVTYEPEPHYATPGHDGTRSTVTTTTDSTGAMSEHWTPKYRGDFKSAEALYVTTKDLVCWSYQVARGMEYLASRQVVHADLAARNLLLAENNVVKICDFGLARNLYKEANYLKKSDDPLPVKWMAIESIRDRVFSTQSDVWSFGIVLWEFFTLAMQPYPGIPLDINFLPLLLDGHRMEKPQYCTLNLYRIIKSCWNQRPDERPNFTQLVAEFGHILDENVKQLFLELNGPYTRMNSVQQEYQNMIRKSRLSKMQAVDYSAKSQQVAHTSAMNDYQIPDPTPRKISIKDKSTKRISKNEGLLDVPKDRTSGYINLNSDTTGIKKSDSQTSLEIEETPQGYMRMSPASSKHKSTHTIFSSEF